jgi:hypothetical protein
MLGDIRYEWSLRRRPPHVTPTPSGRPPARTRSAREAQVPEWKTEAWMRRVEAEARYRLRRDIRNIGVRCN